MHVLGLGFVADGFDSRRQVLDWLSLAINLSKKRTQDAYTYDNDEGTVTSTSFLTLFFNTTRRMICST